MSVTKRESLRLPVTKRESLRLPVTDRKAIISDSCFKRLSIISGIDRISVTSYKELRLIIIHYLNKILSNSVVFMEHANRKTIMDCDIQEAMKLLHFKNQRRVSIHQNETKNNLIPLNSFSNLVRDIAKNKTKTKVSPRIADDALHFLKLFIEKRVLLLLKDAKRNAIHSKRTTVQGEDIRLAFSYHS